MLKSQPVTANQKQRQEQDTEWHAAHIETLAVGYEALPARGRQEYGAGDQPGNADRQVDEEDPAPPCGNEDGGTDTGSGRERNGVRHRAQRNRKATNVT